MIFKNLVSIVLDGTCKIFRISVKGFDPLKSPK